MAVLACIVVACSARLESLDLTLDWSSTSSINPYAEHLLVRPFHISVPFIIVPCFASAERGAELQTSTSSVNPYAQHLLVRPFHISVPFIIVPCFASAERGAELQTHSNNLCPLWQNAAVLCKQLLSLHLAVRAEDLLWPGQTDCAELALRVLGCDLRADKSYDGIDISDPWTMAKTR